jgi:peptide chain release factor 3
MAVERERGISVSAAVMSFEHQGLALNLLDTPATRILARTPTAP